MGFKGVMHRTMSNVCDNRQHRSAVPERPCSPASSLGGRYGIAKRDGSTTAGSRPSTAISSPMSGDAAQWESRGCARIVHDVSHMGGVDTSARPPQQWAASRDYIERQRRELLTNDSAVGEELLDADGVPFNVRG